jgi:quercetin dioxygenase-like cupin family protein
MPPEFLHLADLAANVPDVPPDSILSRTFYEGEDMAAILFAFAPGQKLSEHTAARPAVLHFLRGEAALTLGGEERRAGAGTWVHMAPHLPHSVVAETEVVMLLLLIGPSA